MGGGTNTDVAISFQAVTPSAGVRAEMGQSATPEHNLLGDSEGYESPSQVGIAPLCTLLSFALEVCFNSALDDREAMGVRLGQMSWERSWVLCVVGDTPPILLPHHTPRGADSGNSPWYQAYLTSRDYQQKYPKGYSRLHVLTLPASQMLFSVRLIFFLHEVLSSMGMWGMRTPT